MGVGSDRNALCFGDLGTSNLCSPLLGRLVQLWIMLLVLGYVASLSTKLSDTTASEVGKAYGKRTFLITTLKAVPRGTEGAVSLEGTVAGIVASVAIALVAWAVGLISPYEHWCLYDCCFYCHKC